MRYLEQDAGAIPRLVVRPLCTTMFHVFQHLQCGIDQLMRLVAMNVDNHAYAAGIMLMLRAVKPLPGMLRNFSLLFVKCVALHE